MPRETASASISAISRSAALLRRSMAASALGRSTPLHMSFTSPALGAFTVTVGTDRLFLMAL